MAINVYTQKLCARKATSVRANQRFRLRVKFEASVTAQAGRCAKAKKAVARARITINARRCSGMLGYLGNGSSIRCFIVSLLKRPTNNFMSE